MVGGWLHRHPRFVDWTLLAIALATMVGAAARHSRPALGVPVALATCLPLLLRRRYPLAVLAVTTVGTAVVLAGWGYDNPFPAGVALYTVADQLERRVSLPAGVAALVLLAIPFDHTSNWSRDALGRLVVFSLAWVIGDSVGVRRRYVAALEERAERLEHERAAEAARAAAEEQARIARELHDVLAHNVSVMVVQAAAANDVFDSSPEEAKAALENIEATGRGALAELRRLLGVVRDGAGYAPQPSLERLDELVEHVRAAGLRVAVTIEGRPRPLPSGIDLSAYRVVQEALTNTLKHAKASRAEIALRFGPDALEVEVRDDGAGAANGDGGGSGLIGMRERVAVYGGSLSAGSRSDGGFAVAAHFPLAGEA